MTDTRNYAQSHPVVRMSSKRFAASPFLERYVTDDAVLGAYSGRLYALSLGSDPVEDYWHLRRHAALFDVPEHPIQVEGPDAERFLDHVLARDVGALAVGRARYAIACNERGGILMDGVLIRRSGNVFWYVLADGEIMRWFEAHARGFDVTISDPSSWVLQVQGPTSLGVLDAACDGGAPVPFPYFGVSEVEMGGQPVLISRTGWSGELGFEIYTAEGVDAAALWDHLLDAGADHDLAVLSLEALGIRRIEAGILDNGSDMNPSLTPFDVGLGRVVDMGKPAFIGRDALATAERRSRLYGVSGPSTPVPGTSVLHGDTVVGSITAGAWSPHLEHGIGYVIMREVGEWEGQEVLLAGEVQPFEVVKLPYYDAERKLPRGLA